MRPHRLAIWCIGFVLFATASAKEPPAQVIVWPASGPPVVRFSFGKFKEISAAGKQHNYTTDVTAENLWTKKLSSAEFMLYVFDKAKVRVGDGWISITDLSPGGVVKFQTFINASGPIASFELVPRSLPTELQAFLPPKTISITVNSVPQGAELKSTVLRQESRQRSFKLPRGNTCWRSARRGSIQAPFHWRPPTTMFPEVA